MGLPLQIAGQRDAHSRAREFLRRVDPGAVRQGCYATARGVSGRSLGMGAQWLLAQLRLSPARLLRAGG